MHWTALPMKFKHLYGCSNEDIINHPCISNNKIVARRKCQSGGYSWACIFLEEDLAGFEIRGSFTTNLVAAHEKEHRVQGAVEREQQVYWYWPPDSETCSPWM